MKKHIKSFLILSFIFIIFISYQGCGVTKQVKSAANLAKCEFRILSVGNKPTRFLLKLKPTIMIGEYALIYPGYINVKTEFTSL